MQATRPQTIGYALVDSPVALAAWMLDHRPATPRVTVPVGFTSFPDEIFQAPRSWVEHGYPTLSYFHQADRGGHFAAWEEPQLFSEEIRATGPPPARSTAHRSACGPPLSSSTPSGGDAMPGSTANQGHGVVLLALGQVLDAELASLERTSACGPGEVVGGIDP
jgi:hypothetical protein